MDAKPLELMQLQGVLEGLEVMKTETSAGQRLGFNAYRFSFGERSMVLYSLRGIGSTAPFLAAGDRVEVIAHWHGNMPREEGLVYALRNLEDGRIYLAHGIFRIRFSDRALTTFTARWLRDMVQVLGMLALMTTVLLGVISLFVGADWSPMLICAGVCAIGIAMVAVSYAIGRALWRLGWTTRRQRLAQRVYAALGLGSPLASRLPARVYEV